MTDILDKTEVVENREIEFLTNFDISFVSLVDHAGTRAPFKIIRKQEKRAGEPLVKTHFKENRMLDAVQSILVPSGVDIEELKASKPWLHGLVVSSVDSFDHYKKYHHQDVGAFKTETFRIERLDKGALALVGELSDPVPDALMFHSQVTRIDAQSFTDLATQEINSMLTGVVTPLEDTQATNADKKEAVFRALDMFRTYVSMALDNLEEGVELRFDLDSKEERGDDTMSEENRSTAAVGLATGPGSAPTDLPPMGLQNTNSMSPEEQTIFVDTLTGSIVSAVTSAFRQALTEARAAWVEESKLPPANTGGGEVTIRSEAPDPTVELRAQLKELEERLVKYEEEDSDLAGRSCPEATEEIARSDQSPSQRSVFSGLILRR